MQVNRMWYLAVAGALCFSPVFAQAGGGSMQQPGQQTQPGSTSPGMQPPEQQQQMGGMNSPTGPAMDKEFVKKAMEGNLAEIQMGQLALQKSSDDQVKQ